MRMRMTAPDLLQLGVVERIIDEPAGGAHQDGRLAASNVDQALGEALGELLQLTPDELVDDRYRRFRAIGAFLA
jgi:acetyl-CoA carboxylase carboxyl transferase subunit alpha